MFTTSRTPFTALVSIGAWITTSVANSLLKFSSLAPASMATRNGCFDMAYAPEFEIVIATSSPSDGWLDENGTVHHDVLGKDRGGVLWSRCTCGCRGCLLTFPAAMLRVGASAGSAARCRSPSAIRRVCGPTPRS